MPSEFRTLEWIGDIDGHLRLLDQTRLPADTVYLDCRTVEDVWQAIKRLSVRGAGHRCGGGVWGVYRRQRASRCGRRLQVSGDEPADGGEFVLGAGTYALFSESSRP